MCNYWAVDTPVYCVARSKTAHFSSLCQAAAILCRAATREQKRVEFTLFLFKIVKGGATE